MSVNLSLTCASLGRISVNLTPGIRVAIGLKTLRTLSGHVFLGVPQVDMARPALEVNENDALGLAPARAAAAGRLGRMGLQSQQRAERQAQHAGPAHAEQIPPGDPQFPIAKILAGLSGYDKHDCLLGSAK